MSAEQIPEPVPSPVRPDAQRVALVGLLILASLYTAYVARSFIVPVLLAALLGFVFNPVVRGLERVRIPRALGAAVVVLVLVGTIGFAIYSLTGPASAWIAKAPQSMAAIEQKLRKLRKPVEEVSRTAERVGQLTEMAPPGAAGAQKPLKVEVQGPSWSATLFGGTQALVSAAFVIAVLLYFMLASGDVFLGKLVKVMPRLEDKKRAVQIARETEDQISYYLGTVTIINIVFGAAVAVAMALLGLPNAVLWGVLAAVTNFVPYLGALVMLVVLGLVALLQFDDTSRALMVPLAFGTLNLMEGYILTPLVHGKRLTLNPVIVFLGVLFWGWLWGVAGALMAVPLLAVLKIVCDRVEGLSALGEFLGP
jgi:predicted PurR-regulated permease PerM